MDTTKRWPYLPIFITWAYELDLMPPARRSLAEAMLDFALEMDRLYGKKRGGAR